MIRDGRRDDSGAAGRQRVAYTGAVAAVCLGAGVRQAFGVDAVDDGAAVVLGMRGVHQLRGAKQADGGEHHEGNADSSLHSCLLKRFDGSRAWRRNPLAPF